MKVHVDRELCEGNALCTGSAPDVFDLDLDDKSVVRLDPIPSDLEDDVRRAAFRCPTGAIVVSDE